MVQIRAEIEICSHLLQLLKQFASNTKILAAEMDRNVFRMVSSTSENRLLQTLNNFGLGLLTNNLSLCIDSETV